MTEEASNHPQGYRVSAMAFAEMGDTEAAAEQVRRGLAVAPNDPGLQAIDKLLVQRVDRSRFQANIGKLKAWLQPPAAEKVEVGAAQERVLDYASAMPWTPPLAARAMPSQAGTGGPPRLELGKDGLLKLQLGDFVAAERHFTERIERQPENWMAFRFRALTRRNLKNPAEAQADATEAIRLNPNDAWAYDIRALALLDQQRYDEAVRDADRSIALDPRRAPAWRTRALAWEKLGRREEMLADLKQAAELDAQYEAVYRQALESGAGSAPAGKEKPWLPWGFGLLGAGILMLYALRRPLPPNATPVPSFLRQAQQPEGFELLRLLGHGGMGEVYEAMDMMLRRRVALKRMRSEIANDPRERRRFLREARIVAGLHHPNIVQIFSVVDSGAGLFLVFELVPGQTLAELISDGKRLPLGEALELLRPVAEALDFAHGEGVIHRDLKPANIMLSGSEVKVMDFGIARSRNNTLSTAGQLEVMGTPAYMAPEQELGETVRQSDVYALGVTLYEMVAGETPFPAGQLDAKLSGDFRRLSEAAGVARAVDRAVARALAPEPQDRFPTAAAFLAALARPAEA